MVDYMNKMKETKKMRYFLVFIIILIIVGFSFQIFQYKKTQAYIEKYDCKATNNIRYESSSEGNVTSKIKYQCENGEIWLNDYHWLDSLKVWID